MQFGFVPGKGTVDAPFMVRHVINITFFKQRAKDLWFAFVDLENPFDRVPREVVLWAFFIYLVWKIG